MDKKPDFDKTLFLRYINNTCSEREFLEINKKYSLEEQESIIQYLLDELWEHSETTSHHNRLALLKKIHHQIEKRNLPTQKPKGIDYFYYTKIAASILIFLSVIFFFKDHLFNNTAQETIAIQLIEKSTLPGQKLTFQLPDGSKVILNAGASLTYPEQFTDSVRQVSLKGEAFFDVEKNPSQPFQVNANDIQIVVLGTQFNADADESSVALVEGKVKVNSENSESATLLPGEMARFDTATHLLAKSSFHYDEFVAWKDGTITFDNKPLGEIIHTLETWYGVEIKTDMKIDLDETFSGKLNNETLDNILRGLCYALDCNYKLKDKNVEMFKN